jgi:hypothetical protein
VANLGGFDCMHGHVCVHFFYNFALLGMHLLKCPSHCATFWRQRTIENHRGQSEGNGRSSRPFPLGKALVVHEKKRERKCMLVPHTTIGFSFFFCSCISHLDRAEKKSVEPSMGQLERMQGLER